MILVTIPVVFVTTVPLALVIGHAIVQQTMYLEMILISAIILPIALLAGWAGAYRMDSISCDTCNTYYHATIDKSLAEVEIENFAVVTDQFCNKCRGYT